MSCWRKRTFSAISSDLLRARSVSVASGKEVPSGLVQCVMREESASKQLFFSSAARDGSQYQPYNKLLHHVNIALFKHEDAVNDV